MLITVIVDIDTQRGVPTLAEITAEVERCLREAGFKFGQYKVWPAERRTRE